MFGYCCQEFASPDGKARVALATLAMGDTAACEFAQGSHIGVLHRFKVLSGSELICPSYPMPRSLLSVGIVIDDLVILEKCLRGEASGREEAKGGRRLDSAHAAYCAADLEANPAKGVRDVSAATFWGARLDGSSGVLRASPTQVWPLSFITVRVAALGLVTHGLLESLIGSWTAVFVLKRRCLSLIDVAFEALRHSSPRDVIRMSPALVDEFWSWALVASVWAANLRAPVLDAFFTTDASDSKIACASAASAVSEECLRHTLIKGAWNRLLPAPKAWLRAKGLLEEDEELLEGVAYTPHPLWRVLARSLKFTTSWVLEAKLGQHINIKELRGLLELERRVASKDCGVLTARSGGLGSCAQRAVLL